MHGWVLKIKIKASMAEKIMALYSSILCMALLWWRRGSRMIDMNRTVGSTDN